MPVVASVNRTSGIYRSDCCGAQLALPAFRKFPPCDSRKSFCCKGPNSEWILVRRTSPVAEPRTSPIVEPWILPDRVV
jgi:hypothetical protein